MDLVMYQFGWAGVPASLLRQRHNPIFNFHRFFPLASTGFFRVFCTFMQPEKSLFWRRRFIWAICQMAVNRKI
jgi:hypothetical protein